MSNTSPSNSLVDTNNWMAKVFRPSVFSSPIPDADPSPSLPNTADADASPPPFSYASPIHYSNVSRRELKANAWETHSLHVGDRQT